MNMEFFQLNSTYNLKDFTSLSNAVPTKEDEKILLSPCKYGEPTMQPYENYAKVGNEKGESIVCKKKSTNHIVSKFNAIAGDLSGNGD